MIGKWVFPLICAGCAAAEGGAAGDAAQIAPEGLTVMALPGGHGVLELVALTLRTGPNGLEMYAALTNRGEVPACDAAVAVELFDASQQPLAAGIGGVRVRSFYRGAEASGPIVGCVAPGELGMASIDDLPASLPPEDVAFVVYRCPYFALEVSPVEGLTVRDLKPASRDAGSSYTGALVNGFEVALRNPSVAVFPVNRVGRPLGMAVARSELDVPPGERWSFETDAVDAPGADYVAFPAGAPR